MGSDDIESRRRRAQWRASHRGTKELDLMIGRYAAAHLPAMDETRLAEFEAFLSTSEPELQTWLLGPETQRPATLAPLITDVRRFNGLK